MLSDEINNEMSPNKKGITVVLPDNEINVEIYKDFYNRYKDVKLSDMSVDKLIEDYDKGNQLLNQYYIQCDDENIIRKTDIVIQFQYILGQLNHNINTKLHCNLEHQLKRTKELNKNMKNAGDQLKDIQKVLKEITTTIISIILAVSIIPTAITGIQNINPNYILPFISTISLIGMSTILYVYLMHQVKINKSAIIVYILSITTMILLWLMTWEIDINVKPRENPTMSQYENSTAEE